MLTDTSDVNDGAARHLEQHEERVAQVAGAAVAARREHLRRHDLLVQQPAHQVDLVHGGVVDRHVAGIVPGHRRVAVGAVHHQRCTDGAAGERRLQRAVGSIVATHEADLDQAPAELHLGLEDAQAGILRGRQRLLAEHRLAGGDAGQHIFLVRTAPRGDDDGIDRLVGDQLLPGGKGLCTRQAVGHGLGPGGVDVGHRDHGAARQHLGQASDMILPDHADADDTHIHGHLVWSSWMLSPAQASAGGSASARRPNTCRRSG